MIPEVEARVCPVCGQRLAPWFEKLGRRVYVCPSCHHIRVPAGVALSDDGVSIYESEQPIFERDGNAEYYLDDANLEAARAKARFVQEWCPESRKLLDVGASYGHFLSAISGTQDAQGIEVSPAAVAWSVKNLGVRSCLGSVYDIPPQLPDAFDVITCWDVIEHLEQPRRALEACRNRLKPRGWLFLSTPDAGSVVARMMGRHWHYMDPIQHINLFSQANLKRVLEEVGFQVRTIRYFGHEYRVSYVASRLTYLSRGSLLGPAVRVASLLAQPLGRARINLRLWDVMGIAAQL